MNSFQNFTRNEIDYLKGKISTMEGQVDELQRSFTPYQMEDFRSTFGPGSPGRPLYQNYAGGRGNVTMNQSQWMEQQYVSGRQGFQNSIYRNPTGSFNMSMQRDTFGGMNQGGGDWNRIYQYVLDGDINEAYSQALIKSKDDMILIKLMGKTGVCLSKLNKSVLEYLVEKIVDLISKRDFLNVLVLWAQELANILVEDHYAMNFNVTSNFIECLKRMSDDYNVPQQMRSMAKQNYETLNQTF